jgi:transmembrane 9 superfamily member 2/4
MMRHRPQFLVGLLALFFSYCHCFYVPGWSPHIYRVGDPVPLWLNKVSSERTHLPYAYSELPGVCKPTNAQTVSLNLGEILRGGPLASSRSDYRRPDF